MTRAGSLAVVLVVAVLILVAAAAFIFLLNNNHANSTVSCTTVPNVTRSAGSGNFAVEIFYQGRWSAVVKTYSAFETNSTYLRSSACYIGGGDASVYIAPWNPNGEQSVVVVAQKLEASNGNLTVSVAWGAATRSNSTLSPYGSVTTSIGTAP